MNRPVKPRELEAGLGGFRAESPGGSFGRYLWRVLTAGDSQRYVIAASVRMGGGLRTPLIPCQRREEVLVNRGLRHVIFY